MSPGLVKLLHSYADTPLLTMVLCSNKPIINENIVPYIKNVFDATLQGEYQAFTLVIPWLTQHSLFIIASKPSYPVVAKWFHIL